MINMSISISAKIKICNLDLCYVCEQVIAGEEEEEEENIAQQEEESMIMTNIKQEHILHQSNATPTPLETPAIMSDGEQIPTSSTQPHVSYRALALGDKAYKCNYDGCGRLYTTQHHLKVCCFVCFFPFLCEAQWTVCSQCRALGTMIKILYHSSKRLSTSLCSKIWSTFSWGLVGTKIKDLVVGVTWLGYHDNDLVVGVTWLGYHTKDLVVDVTWLGYHTKDLVVGVTWPGYHTKKSH